MHSSEACRSVSGPTTVGRQIGTVQLIMSADRNAEWDEFAAKRVTVLGLAREGTAMARHLAETGAKVTVTDLRTESELAQAVDGLGRPTRTEQPDSNCHDSPFAVLRRGTACSARNFAEFNNTARHGPDCIRMPYGSVSPDSPGPRRVTLIR